MVSIWDTHMGPGMNGASLRHFPIANQLKILAKNGIMRHEIFDADVPRFSSSDPSPQASFRGTKTC